MTLRRRFLHWVNNLGEWLSAWALDRLYTEDATYTFKEPP